MKETDTYIRLKKNTRERLANIGKKNDSYDSIINRLLDFFLQNKGD